MYERMKARIGAIYIAAKDMDRAVNFYEKIFNRKATYKNERMSVFEFDNITLLII